MRSLILISLVLIAVSSCKKEDVNPIRNELPGTYRKVYPSNQTGKYNEYIITSTSNDTLNVYHRSTKVDSKLSLLSWIPYLGDIIGDEVTVHYYETGKLIVTDYEEGYYYECLSFYEEKKENVKPGIAPWRSINPNPKVIIRIEVAPDGWIITTPENGDSFLAKKN